MNEDIIPQRLFDVKKNKVINNLNIKEYIIVSYVWSQSEKKNTKIKKK
jgi:hypothetical protein